MKFLVFVFASVPLLLFGQADTVPVKPEAQDTLLIKENLSPAYSISAVELENENESQDVSGLLHSSRDVFTAASSFTFSAARFRFRQYNSGHTLVYINGVRMNDPETGLASYSTWGGLNDVMRFSETRQGIAPFRFGFSGIGGATHIDTRPSLFRKGLASSYAYSNRLYDHRVMLTMSSGMLKNGWAFTASGSRRWSEEGYVPGTYMDSWSYYFGAEKKISDKHSVVLTTFGAPSIQGRQGTAVAEATELAGDNFYNPLWGYQNGEKRNARVSHVHEPVIIASHIWKRAEKDVLQSSLFYSFGRNGVTNLNWYDAKDPRPDYYRYLPSYQKDDSTLFGNVKAAWMNDVNVRQINWDQLYFANSKNLYTVYNANGDGTNIEGKRSKYIVEEARQDQKMLGFSSTWSKSLRDNLNFSAGVSAMNAKTHNFKVMEDLLGGDFWVDVDQFAEQLSADSSVAQNDLENPNKVVKVGDKFGFDYVMEDNMATAFAQAELSLPKVDLYGAVNGMYNSFKRVGNVQNGRFPEESFGDSPMFTFLTYGAKAGATYKITGRHFFTVNSAYYTRPPLPRNIYISPRTRSAAVNNVDNESVISGDANYIVRYPRLKGRATVYYTQINDQTVQRSFYHDQFRTFINYTMTNVDHLYMGAELGVDINVLPELQLTLVGTQADALFNSRPSVTITQDNSAEVLATDKVVYLKNYHVGGSPEEAYSVGLKYTGKKFWFAGVNFNYYDDIYVDPNPDRRTEEALASFVTTDPQVNTILAQEQLKPGYTVDFFGGKSWRIKKYYIALNVSATNLLDKKDFRVSGFEQLRYDAKEIERFPAKYSYHFGRTFYAMLTFRF